MKITMEKSGSYDVLLMGTRKDELASGSWKGPVQLEDLTRHNPPPEPAN